MVTIERTKLEQVLEALKATIDVPCYGGHPKQEAAAVAIQEALAQPAQEPVQFLAGGTRFKLSLDDEGKVNCFWNFRELDGKWVALVAAEDDCHLKLTTPPQRTEQEQPLPPVEIGVDVTADGASVVAFYRRPNAVMEMFYSQFHPAPKRPWVGLTDGDVIDLQSGYQSGRIGSFVDLIVQTAAKLKEKNNGT